MPVERDGAARLLVKRHASLGAIVVAGLAWAFTAATAQDLSDIPLTHPAIQYDKASNDPIAALLRRPDALKRLTPDGPSGYLRSLLAALDVPVESQILVFSKGSLQSQIINAANPRALYFNDSVVVGWVRGGLIEIAAQDPSQGTIFYMGDPSARALTRTDDRCLSCHFSPRTGLVPGMIEPMSHRRPLDQRWGGWYVTGTLGGLQHFGNVDVADLFKTPGSSSVALTSLEKTFDVRGYLTPHSDVAALLVFEHQMQMMNLLARLGWETRTAIHERRLDASRSAIVEPVNRVVDYMLFVDEAPVPSKVEGSSGFTRVFSARGPHDARGRSLYQLDLTQRVLRYPCSYLIYSEQFDRLPAEAQAAVYRRLWAILGGAEKDAKYRRLALADRRAIVEILRDTKPELPDYFRSVER
jgi:hypothetical protein